MTLEELAAQAGFSPSQYARRLARMVVTVPPIKVLLALEGTPGLSAQEQKERLEVALQGLAEYREFLDAQLPQVEDALKQAVALAEGRIAEGAEAINAAVAQVEIPDDISEIEGE